MIESTLQLILIGAILLLSYLLIGLISFWHVIYAMENRMTHSRSLLHVTVHLVIITMAVIDLATMLIIILRPSKKLLDYWENDSIIRLVVPSVYTDYRYAKQWNIADLVKAERKLSGLCIECGIGEDNTRQGHHDKCMTCCDTQWNPKSR